MRGENAKLIQLWRKMIGISRLIGVVAGLGFLPNPVAIAVALLTFPFAFVALSGVWMIYAAVVKEKHPWPMIALAAFVPFAGLWYYFPQVRRVPSH